MAADMVKMNRNRNVPFNKGDCISVVREFFDTPEFKYSNELPVEIDRILGRVKYVFSNSVSVQWDLDNTVTSVKYDAITKEDNSVPCQALPGLSTQEQPSRFDI